MYHCLPPDNLLRTTIDMYPYGSSVAEFQDLSKGVETCLSYDSTCQGSNCLQYTFR